MNNLNSTISGKILKVEKIDYKDETGKDRSFTKVFYQTIDGNIQVYKSAFKIRPFMPDEGRTLVLEIRDDQVWPTVL